MKRLLLMLCLTLSGCTQAETLHDFKLENLRNFGAASESAMEFRLWIPPKTGTLKYLLILVPGSNGYGRHWADDQAWQNFAANQDAALLACRFFSPNWSDYEHPGWWSGKALTAAIKQAAKVGRHPEIETIPLLLWGHSAGGIFSYNLANWQPKRVAAFALNKGGVHTTEPNDAVLQVPGIFMVGANDSIHNFGESVQRYLSGRRRGAIWCFAAEPNSGHELGQTAILGRAFFNSVIAYRSKDISWYGNLTDHAIHPKDQKPNPNAVICWLPDESFAKIWQTFVTGGKITD